MKEGNIAQACQIGNNMQPEILYRTTDGQPFYLWDDGLYYIVSEDDSHLHHGYSYGELVATNAFQEDYTIGSEKVEEQYNKYRAFIERVATGKRPDGTYNYCREALEKEAKELLK